MPTRLPVAWAWADLAAVVFLGVTAWVQASDRVRSEEHHGGDGNLMEEGLSMLAALAAMLSAAGLYAGSRHCRWTNWRRIGRAGTWGGVTLAVVSLLLWTQALGAGAGFCAMLGSWMFSMIALPYIAGMRVEGAARGDG